MQRTRELDPALTSIARSPQGVATRIGIAHLIPLADDTIPWIARRPSSPNRVGLYIGWG